MPMHGQTLIDGGSMIIAVDFDGTIVTHEYPRIGKDIGAIPVLKDLMKAGHKLILYTMRSGLHLDSAVHFLKREGIKLYGVNDNPQQAEWTSSRKVYAHLYIDDAALGIPLVIPSLDRPFVNWSKVREILKIKGVL